MPSIAENLANWNDPEHWQDDGDEWSESWGSSASMWFGSILPRIHPFLPTGHLLEIACGHGRVTAHLLGHCERYTGVDLAPTCVAVCKRRFAGVGKAAFSLCDGRTLPEVAEASVDFVCSWDSLVHAELDAVEGYLRELARVLRPGGTAFLHHSNLAACLAEAGGGVVPNPHWRASSVSAVIVQRLAAASGLACEAQEVLQWGGEVWNDCFTLLRRPARGEVVAPTRTIRHPSFALELEHFRRLDTLWRSPTGG